MKFEINSEIDSVKTKTTAKDFDSFKDAINMLFIDARSKDIKINIEEIKEI